VDEIIHLKILESVLDYPPSTIVLASGDGAAGEYSPGFTKVIERCLTRGWEVEVLSFKQNLSGFYRNKEFKKTWKDKFRFIPLDGFVEELLD
jgi:predicted alpha/beta-hydrolase family hydrolase